MRTPLQGDRVSSRTGISIPAATLGHPIPYGSFPPQHFRRQSRFHLPEEKVKALIDVGQELLDQSEYWKRLVKILKSEPELGAGMPSEHGNCS